VIGFTKRKDSYEKIKRGFVGKIKRSGLVWKNVKKNRYDKQTLMDVSDINNF
jgi:hypothetical protein